MVLRFFGKRLKQGWICAIVALLSGCGGGSAYDASSATSKQALLDAVTIQLTKGDCRAALALIAPVYNSKETDNQIRMAMASANGCAATINLFEFLASMASNGSVFSGGGFWGFLAQEFPSVVTDDIAQGALAAQDALMSVIDPGWAVLLSDMFNVDTFNPATYNVHSRKAEANAYLFFASMAAIGAIENRYGLPDADGHPSTSPPLPWVTATDVTADGCAFGASLVNFVDSLQSLQGSVPGSLAEIVTTLHETFSTAIFTACNEGCTNALISGCSLSACSSCPQTLRNRESCTGVVTDPNSCATAGLINMINTPGLGWD